MLKSINDAPDDLQYEIKRYTDWDWDAAASIAFLESGWDWTAHADTTQGGAVPCGTPLPQRDGVNITAEDSYSYFQINACNFPGWVPAMFFNTKHNVGTAHMLFNQRGWAPWFFSAQKLGLL